jgi:preprotein translocase subunit SecD
VITPGGSERQRHDRGVETSGLEADLQVLGEVLLDVERHQRRAIVQRRDEVRQQVRRDGIDDAQREHSGELVAARLRDVANARRFLEHALRLLDDALSDGRHRDFALAALEHQRAELFLELLDRHRQRGLAHEALLRRHARSCAPAQPRRDSEAR